MTDDQIIEARARAIFAACQPWLSWPENEDDCFAWIWNARLTAEKLARATLAADKAAGYWMAPMEATEEMLEIVVPAPKHWDLDGPEGSRMRAAIASDRMVAAHTYRAMRDAALRARHTQEGT